MKVYSNPYSAINVQNNQNKAVNNNLKYTSRSKEPISFGVTNECFAKWLTKTAKGAEKSPGLADNIVFEVQKPTPEKKQALLNALKNVDDWYKGVLEGLAEDWGLKINK